MTSIRWHQFVQPYEPRELDPDPFYDLADRAAPRAGTLVRESLPVPPDMQDPGIFMERSRHGNRS